MRPALRLAARTCVVAALVGTLACRGRDGPDVVLITLDTARADRLGTMGHAEAHTPALDALASRGVVYERAFASVPLTLPSHATMLTGLEPPAHGVHDNGRFTLSPSAVTVAERLHDAGWDTAAVVSAFVLDGSFGLERGFATYDDAVESVRDPMRWEMPRRPGPEVTDRALAWLGTRREAHPFFLWVHYYDLHQPRRPPPPYAAMADPYDGALASVDAEVARLLDGVARAAGSRPTLIIVVGDHGEGLGEHGEETHGTLVYDGTLHVPLIVAGPGFVAGSRSRAFVRTADVAPTILAAAGLPAIAEATGRPLSAGRAVDDDVAAPLGWFECLGPAERLGWAALSGVRDGRWKYTAEPSPAELYDVLADPEESVDRTASEPEVAARLEAAWRSHRPANTPSPAAPGALPRAEVEEKLAALGYVQVTRPRGAAGEPLPDTRRFVAALQIVDAAHARAAEGAVAAAIDALEALATSPIAEPLALMHLAQLQLLAGKPPAAVRTAERLVASSDSLEPKLLLAQALLQAGRADDALRTIAAAGTPDDRESARVRLVRGSALLALGRHDEAQAEADRAGETARFTDAALALASRAAAARDGARAEVPRLRDSIRATPDPTAPRDSRMLLAELLRDVGRDDEATAVLEAVLPQAPEEAVLLGDIAVAHGNHARAASLYAQAVADRPAVAAYRRRLADEYGALGRGQEAVEQYDALLAIVSEDPGVLVDRGATFAMLGRSAEAEADYRRALAVEPDLPEAHLNLALVALAAGREAEAEEHLQRAVTLRPDYRKAHFHLARVYARRRDPRGREHADRAAGVEDSVPVAEAPSIPGNRD